MRPSLLSRRELSWRLITLLPALNLATEGRAQASNRPSADANGISRTCECIHQEVVIKASRARIYRALTDTSHFSKVTSLSIPGASTEISSELGGAFSLFGGVIVGRHIEMVPDQRLVQAWREKTWDAGVYSVVRFQLNDSATGTKLVFDQTGFPQGAADLLAIGWKSHYWEPLQKYLA